MNKNLFIIIIVLLFTGCTSEKKPEGFKVSGTIVNGFGKKIIFSEMDVKTMIRLDSVILDQDGQFEFSNSLTEKSFFVIDYGMGNVILVPDNNEKIQISGDFLQTAETFEINGSEGSQLYKDFLKESASNIRKADTLKAVLKEHEDLEDFYSVSLSVDSAFLQILRDQKEIQNKMIDQNPGVFTTLLILNYSFGMGPVLDESEDLGIYQKTDSILFSEYPENKHVLYHHMRVIELKKRDRLKKNTE